MEDDLAKKKNRKKRTKFKWAVYVSVEIMVMAIWIFAYANATTMFACFLFLPLTHNRATVITLSPILGHIKMQEMRVT